MKIIIEFAYNKLFPTTKATSNKRRFIKIKFANKGIDLLNISGIFRDDRVQAKVPQYFSDMTPPTICFQYKRPIRNIIFNYNKVTSNISDSALLPSCNCKNSKFIYKPAGHIITGDLNVIEDSALRSLILKGPKYRLPSRIDFKACRKIIEDALISYAKHWCKQEGVENHALSQWKNMILSIIDIRINICNFLSHPHLFQQPKVSPVSIIKNK